MDTNPAPNAYADAWADAIIAGRGSKNLTRAELAEKLKVAYQAVQQWETGRTQPSPRNQALLYGLGIVTAEQLSSIMLRAAHDPKADRETAA